jgi:hypothetical protein
MDPTLNLILDVILGFSLGLALYNWVLVLMGRDKYLVCAISVFVMGAASAFSYQWCMAIWAALLILILALYRRFVSKF